MEKNNEDQFMAGSRGFPRDKREKNVTINIKQDEVISYENNGATEKKQETKNLHEGLLSKVNMFEQRANKTPSVHSSIHRHKDSKSDERRPVERRNNNEKKKSIFMMNNPLEEEEEDEKEEKNLKKVEFNQVVEEMAQFYINEPEFSTFYVSQFIETVGIHLIYFLFGPLIVPLLFMTKGKNFIRNMGRWGKKLGSSHRVQIFYWVSFVVTVVFTIFILNAENDTTCIWRNQLVFLSPAYIAQIMVLIRYLTVCVKYGFFPREYYEKWKTTRLTRTEIKSNFLLQGWIKPSLLVLDVYLKEIFQKFNIDVNYFKFQFAGKLPEKMRNSLLEVDKMINEDARRIRLSIFRRFKKETSLYNMIQKAIKNNNKSDDDSETHEVEDKNKDKNNSTKTLELVDMSSSNRSESIFNQSQSIENSMASNSPFTINSNEANPRDERMITRPSIELEETPIVTGKKRLRQIILEKILPDVRARIKNNVNSIDSKVKCKNEFSYEIKGIYLCRALLKDVCNLKLESYVIMHKLFVFLIWLVPFIFTFIYYVYFNNLIVNEMGKEFINTINSNKTHIDGNITSNNSTKTTMNFPGVKTQGTISFHHVSIILLVFSAVSLVPPVWLNTLNLLYGVVDIRRKKKFMEILTEMINTNLKEENRQYPLLNVTNSNSVLNWYYLRNIFLSFGKRFGDRIILQTSIFCLFVIIALIISILTLFGWFNNQFLALCLGVSFTFSVMINFIIVFRMFLLGAEFNFYEFIHGDWMLTHKLFIDELINNTKLLKSIKKNKGKNPDSLSDKTRNRDTVFSSNTSNSRVANSTTDKFPYIISNNINSEIFVKILLSDETLSKSGDPINYFIKSSRILENIKEKIKVDSFVRPLKIFWIKSDYAMIGRIIALVGTGVAMICSNIIKGVDINKYLPKQ